MDEDEDIPQDTKTMKRKERLEQNRISARESRKRKKTMIEELQRTVITLSRENKELNDRNEGLRRQLIDVGSKYPNVVPLHAIMTGVPATTSSTTPGNGSANFEQNTTVTSAPSTAFPTFPMFTGIGQPGGAWPAPTANTPAPSTTQQQAP